MKILWQLFTCFFRIGLFTIGGGMAMLPFIYKSVVEEKKWLTEKEMLDCIAISQSLPGVIAINSATYVGSRKAGFPGALAASVGVILPSFIIIIIVVKFLGTVGENIYIDGAFTGIKAASCGLILYSAYRMSRRLDPGWMPRALMVLSFAFIVIFGFSAIWAILAGIFFGLIYQWLAREKGTKE